MTTILILWMGIEAWAQPSDGDRFSSLLQRGFELHKEARFAEAIPVLEDARRIQPEDYFVNLLLGIDLLRTGKGAESVSHLRLAASSRGGLAGRR